MENTRQRLFEYIQAQRIVSAADLSRALRMTSANVRHHLAILEEQGRVQVVGQRETRKKGRPALLYGPSEQVLGHNLDRLVDALLNRLQQNDPGENLLPGIAACLAGELAKKPGTLGSQLIQVVKRLNEMHYRARWEARAGGPRLILGHCPYTVILPAHPEICRMDGYLLEALLSRPVEQVARLETDSLGARYCAFLVS